MKRDGTILLDKQGSLSDVRSIIGDFKQTEVQTIQIDYGIDGTLSAGDTLTANISFIVSRYKSFGAFQVRLSMQGGRSYILSDAIVNYDYASSTLTMSNMVMPVDVPEDSFISISMGNPTYNADYSSVNFGFGITSYEMKSESEQTGFFNNIIQWLKDIVDKIKGLPDAIGSFINSLGDKISSFFSNLINNLKTWFDNIGKWFTDLGNNIKQWFIDITNNIKTFFNTLGDRISGFFETIWNNTVEFFTSLFKPRDEYFDELREDLDNHMSEHLGAVYNVPKALIEQLTSIVNGVKGADPNHLYIAIPEFAFRLKGEKRVLLEAQQFDLLSSINSIEEGSTKAIINTALIIMHGMIDLFLAVACFKMVYKKIINKVGIEGGDDL